MDNLTNQPDQNVPSVLPTDYGTKSNFWSTKKIILFVLGASIIIVGGFFILFLGVFNNTGQIVTDKIVENIQGGREQNRWEEDYLSMSEVMDYPDLCNKIYTLAYRTVGGGFTGESQGIIYSRSTCLARIAVNTQDSSLCKIIKESSKFTKTDCEKDVQSNDMPSDGLSGVQLNKENNLPQKMGYTDSDFIINFTQIPYNGDFIKSIANGNDFKSRLKNLPDFSNIKDDTKSLSSLLQCPQYSTSYIDGLPGYTPDPAVNTPCCTDLNEDRICDLIQSKNSQSQPQNSSSNNTQNKEPISVEKMNISMTLNGSAFTAHPHDNQAYPEYPYAGYIIKDKPFNAHVVVKNNNTVATNPSDVYLSFSVTNPDGGSVGLGDLSKYATVPIPVLQPGESKSLDFNNLTYTLDLSDNTLNIIARVHIQSDPNDRYVFNSSGFYLFGFSSEKDAQDYLKKMNW